MLPAPVSNQLGQSAVSAVDWVKAHLQQFYALPARIGAAKRKAAALAQAAAALGRADVLASLRNADQELTVALTRQQQAQDRVSALLLVLGGSVKLPQLGQFPSLSLVGQAALVASQVAGLLASVSKQERAIAAADAAVGKAAPTAPGGPPAAAPTVPLWGYALVLGFGGYWLLGRGRRRR